MLTPRTSSARPAVSYGIRHSVFSRRCTSRRATSRSTAVFERAGVLECGTASRFAQAGTIRSLVAPLPAVPSLAAALCRPSRMFP